jgi:hypothetical protein
MSIYLLEIYSTKTGSIPDFGIAFDSIDKLLDYVHTQIASIEDSVKKSAKEDLDIGWSIGLDKTGLIRASKIPLVSDSKDTTYIKYFKPSLQIINTQEEINVPAKPTPKNQILKEKILDGNIIMNYNNLIDKGPTYIKRTTFNSQNRPHINPYTGAPIRTAIKTRKVKIVKTNSENKNENVNESKK